MRVPERARFIGKAGGDDRHAVTRTFGFGRYPQPRSLSSARQVKADIDVFAIRLSRGK